MSTLVIAAGGSEGHVEKLATRTDQRGRGLARGLLADSFVTARQHGAQRLLLATDPRTGALGVYQKIGMVIISDWVNRATSTQQ